jgi:hypothetical protein
MSAPTAPLTQALPVAPAAVADRVAQGCKKHLGGMP